MWGALAGQALEAIGSYFTNRQNMRWNERMANTAWQRGMADMKKAGVNPALAFTQGGAPAPTIHLENPLSGVGGAVASARALKQEKDLQRNAQAIAGQQAYAASKQAETSASLAELAREKFSAERRVPSVDDPFSYHPGSPGGLEAALRAAQVEVAKQQRGYLSSATSARDAYKDVLEQSLRGGELDAEQKAALERILERLPEGIFGDIGRTIIMVLMSQFGQSAVKGMMSKPVGPAPVRR